MMSDRCAIRDMPNTLVLFFSSSDVMIFFSPLHFILEGFDIPFMMYFALFSAGLPLMRIVTRNIKTRLAKN